jgi:hypothetical protein
MIAGLTVTDPTYHSGSGGRGAHHQSSLPPANTASGVPLARRIGLPQRSLNLPLNGAPA